MQGSRSAILLLLICISHSAYAQAQPDKTVAITNFPSRFFNKIEHRISNLDDQLIHQTKKYLERMRKREQRMYEKLCKKDSVAANALFAGSIAQYDALEKQLTSDTGGAKLHLSGEYQPYMDSLQGMLKFLKNDGAAGSLKQLKVLQAKMQDADQIKEFVRQRKQQISQYVQQHANLSGLLGKDFQGMNRNAYYYAQQVHEYRQILNDPDKLEKKALVLLNKLPAFQAFMSKNSQLAGLFNSPSNSNYGNPAALAGLQTRDQVAVLIQQQVSAGGAGGAAALQANLQSARTQLDGYKDKVTKFGGGSGDIDAPDFKPNDQRTKTFWKRLEYGANFQTTRNNYYFPTVSDFGLSVGYKLGGKGTIAVGASYKLGWGNGIQHISFTSQGVGLRPFFLDVKIKGSFSASGGLEYNYTAAFRTVQQLRNWDSWTKSGLIGFAKTVSLKSRVFKKTKAMLLWDFLSYQQVPKTQAVIFRLGYTL